MSSPRQLWGPNLYMPPSDYLHFPPREADNSGPLQNRHHSTQQVSVSVSKAENLEMEPAWRSKKNRQLARAMIPVGWNLQLTEQWPHSWTELLLSPPLPEALHLSSKQTANCALRLVLLTPGSAGQSWLLCNKTWRARFESSYGLQA